jgi:flagellar basal-body rod modification protein FlgD
MSILSAILQHERAAQAPKAAAVLPQASAPSGTTNSSTSASAASAASSTISANDFLTLLVTEMQNQDPTADTDPNEYIDQLVQVNSLEQLIDINQTLGTAFTTPAATGTTTDASTQAAAAAGNASSLTAKNMQPTVGSSLSSVVSALSARAGSSKASANSHAAGNLAIPDASPAALRVAHALNGQSRGLAGKTNSPQTSPAPNYPAH